MTLISKMLFFTAGIYAPGVMLAVLNGDALATLIGTTMCFALLWLGNKTSLTN